MNYKIKVNFNINYKKVFLQFKRILIQGLKNFLRNKMMIFASLLVTLVMMVVIGASYMLSRNINNLIDSYIESEHAVSVYLKESISNEEAQLFAAVLSQDARVKSFEFVSKEAALEDFKSNFPPEDFEYIFGDKDETFLPVSFNVALHDNSMATLLMHDLQIMSFEQLGIEPGEEEFPENEVVREFSSTETLMQRVSKIRSVLNIVGIVVIAILMFFAVIIISNTIMLSVLSRKKEIEIMNHVGATRWYIEGPFIVEGCAIGLVGAGIAFVLLNMLYSFVTGLIANNYTITQQFGIELVPFSDMTAFLIVGLIIVGMAIGSFGAMITSGKYIKN